MNSSNIDQIKIVALVGATGRLGSFLFQNLIKMGYVMRVLVRDDVEFAQPNVDIFKGDLSNYLTLEKMLVGVDCVINASGEVRDIEKMWAANVQGVSNLIQAINKSGVKYFCQISSAGVVGMKGGGWIDEETHCVPQNMYEKSKLEAENIIKSELRSANYCILRPTNIVFPDFNPQVDLVLSDKFLDKIKCYLKAKESCHLVHVYDVAAAILHFIKCPQNTDLNQIYLLSIDHDENNYFSKVYQLIHCKPVRFISAGKLLLGVINYLKYGNLLSYRLFSSKKILETGFNYKYSVELILKEFNLNK